MMKAKRFLLFAGDLQYPNGGAEDFIDSFYTIEECNVKADELHKSNKSRYSWANILDLESFEKIFVYFGRPL